MKPGKIAAFATLSLFAAGSAMAQSGLAKSMSEEDEIFSNGSMSMTAHMTWDAANWTQWKATTGSDPARVRANFRYTYGAQMLIDGFDLKLDDINRSAVATLHSTVGPTLRDDGSYVLPLPPGEHLVNGSGRTWFFSGLIAGTLTETKVTLPAETVSGSVDGGGDTGNELVYTLKEKPGKSHFFLLGGSAAIGVGVLALLVGLLVGKRAAAA